MPYPLGEPRYESEPVPEDFIPVTLDAEIKGKCVGLWVGAAGAVAVKMLDGTSRTIPGVPAGTFLRGRFTQVLTATTVATPTTNILAAVMLG